MRHTIRAMTDEQLAAYIVSLGGKVWALPRLNQEAEACFLAAQQCPTVVSQ